MKHNSATDHSENVELDADRSERRSRVWIIILVSYAILIVSIPLFLHNGLFRDMIKCYLYYLGAQKGPFINLLGAAIGFSFAIMTSKWIQDRDKRKTAESEAKKSALSVYLLLSASLDSLLPFYSKFWYLAHHKDKPKPSYDELIDMFRKRCSALHLPDDLHGSIVKLRHNKRTAFVQEIYSIYVDLCNVRDVISGTLTDEKSVYKILYRCERNIIHEPTSRTDPRLEFRVRKEPLNELREMAGVEPYLSMMSTTTENKKPHTDDLPDDLVD